MTRETARPTTSSAPPGGQHLADGDIELNQGRRTLTLDVTNESRRPVQVSSHYHFYEVNRRLQFDRAPTYGMHLDLLPGRSIRFAAGESRRVRLVAYGGTGTVRGFMGAAPPAGAQ